MKLPIDIIPNTIPPQFKWKQTVHSLNGSCTVENQGGLPPSVESAIIDLLVLTKHLIAENALLKTAAAQKVTTQPTPSVVRQTK